MPGDASLGRAMPHAASKQPDRVLERVLSLISNDAGWCEGGGAYDFGTTTLGPERAASCRADHVHLRRRNLSAAAPTSGATSSPDSCTTAPAAPSTPRSRLTVSRGYPGQTARPCRVPHGICLTSSGPREPRTGPASPARAPLDRGPGDDERVAHDLSGTGTGTSSGPIGESYSPARGWQLRPR